LVSRWTARRLIVSAFVAFHLSAIIMWTLPPCLIKERFMMPYRYYVLPLGIWQWWAIFAPDPIKENWLLEAEVVDVQGIRRIYEFPTIGDLSWWARVPRYRHPKFTSNMMDPEYTRQRVFAARHVVRQLGLAEEAFPLTVTLYCRIQPTPPPGTATVDPMTPRRIHVIDRFPFESIKEVRP
jgi:hypothetical protein